MKICKYCGGECRDSAAFCEHCGKDLSEADITEEKADGAQAPETETPASETEAPEQGGAAFGQDEAGAARTEPDAQSAEAGYREMRKNRILEIVKSPLFIVLCVAELIALMSGICINLTALPGSSVNIPLLPILVCLGVWMIFFTAMNKGEVPSGWIKFLRVIATILKVLLWIAFGFCAVFAGIAVLLPNETYVSIWDIVMEELLRMGIDFSEITRIMDSLGLSLKIIVCSAALVGCILTAIYAVFYTKLVKFLGCVESEARGDLPGIYPAGIAGFCWFYVMISIFGLCVALLSPPYNVFILISYAAEITSSVAIALIASRIANA